MTIKRGQPRDGHYTPLHGRHTYDASRVAQLVEREGVVPNRAERRAMERAGRKRRHGQQGAA